MSVKVVDTRRSLADFLAEKLGLRTWNNSNWNTTRIVLERVDGERTYTVKKWFFFGEEQQRIKKITSTIAEVESNYLVKVMNQYWDHGILEAIKKAAEEFSDETGIDVKITNTSSVTIYSDF